MSSNATIQLLVPVQLTQHLLATRTLSNKYETNKVIKLYETFLLLKKIAGASGHIKWLNMEELVRLHNLHANTIGRRITQLINDGWATQNKDWSLTLKSWKTIHHLHDIKNSKEYATINYTPGTTTRIHDLLYSLEIQANKNYQLTGLVYKINRNHEHRNILMAACIQAGACSKKISSDTNYFVEQLKLLYIKDFKFGSSVKDIVVLYRPFFDRGIKKIQADLSFKHKTSISYRKQVLVKRNCIAVKSKQTITSTIRARNKHCHVIWSKQQQQTILCLADELIVIEPPKFLAHDNNERTATASRGAA